jgi:hypothetical protein
MVKSRINSTLFNENSKLHTRAVPNNFQYKFTYLIYPYDEDESETHYKVRLIRRQKICLEEKHLEIIRNKTYWIYEENLPSAAQCEHTLLSTTLNKKILPRIFREIPGSRKINIIRIYFMKEHKQRFIDLMKYLILLEKMN